MTQYAIPITRDLSSVVGEYAEKIENRSLLLDKFPMPKSYAAGGASLPGRDRNNNAARWSLLRVSSGGSTVLNAEAAQYRKNANGKNTSEENRIKYNIQAEICSTLSQTKVETPDTLKLRADHSQRLLGLFRESYPADRIHTTIARLEGRLAINLADGLIENAGIALDRLFGMPYMPGSAVKGITRSVALESISLLPGEQQRTARDRFTRIFGTSSGEFDARGELSEWQEDLPGHGVDLKGAVTFLPAYPVNEAQVVVDITTVHYPDYYRSGDTADLRHEDPKPNAFPAVERGAEFAFILQLNGMDNDEALLQQAREWLESALTDKGAGAKTCAGYGWFTLVPERLEEIERSQRAKSEAIAEQQRAELEARRTAEEDAKRLASMSPIDRCKAELLQLNDEEFAERAKSIESANETQQHALIALFKSDKEKRKKLKTWRKKKPDTAKSIETIASKLGEDLS